MSGAQRSAVLPDGNALIGPDWISNTSAGRFDHVNPATGAVQASVAIGGRDEIDRAVAAAERARQSWRRVSPDERRAILFRIAQLLRAHAGEMGTIASLENGVPSTFTPILCGQIPADYFEYYAGWVDKIEGAVIPVYPKRAFDYTRPEPYGTVGVIIPWNAPLGSIGQKVAPALAAGNCVVLKPSELAPFTALKFAALCLEAGLPEGVLNVVVGGAEAGNTLVTHRDVAKVSFTGGGSTARQVLAAASEHLKPVVLELGGKSANVVFADADLDAAAVMAVQGGIVTLSGQGCILPTRLLIEDSVYDEVLEMVVDVTESLVVGDPFDEDTLMGPLVSHAHCERVVGMIERAKSEGAGSLATGGRRMDGPLADGFFVEPTVFADVDNASQLAQQEVFGPVLAVMRFRDEAEAIRLANDTSYGLAAYVHTTDLARAHRVAEELEAGYIGVNGLPLIPANAPFGGIKQSGFGREGGREGLLEFLRTKNVYMEID